MNAKKAKYKHGHVGLLEVTPSISEKPACSRTEEAVKKITKMCETLGKKIKNHIFDKKCREQSDSTFPLSCAAAQLTDNPRAVHSFCRALHKY